MIRFIHATDLHVSAPGTVDPGLRADTGLALRALQDFVAGMPEAPAFVLVTGDLTNLGDVDSYRTARAGLEALGVPLVVTLGNHDSRSGFRAVWPGAGPVSETPWSVERVIAGVRVVALDTSVAGRIGGDLDDGQLALLDAALGRAAEERRAQPVVIGLHHAPQLPGEADWESLTPRATAALRETIGGRPVAGIFCGHIHQDRVAIWEGIPLVTSTGLHCTSDSRRGPELREISGAGCALCTLSPGLTVTFAPLVPARDELNRVSRARIAERDERAGAAG